MSVPYLQTATAVIEIVKALGTGGVLAVLLGSTGLGGVVTAYVAWKKQPVERRDADLAVAEASQGMSLELAQELRAEIGRLRGEINDLRTELRAETASRKDLGNKVRDQDATIFNLRVYVSRVTDWWEHHVVADWERVRAREKPPLFPYHDFDEPKGGG